MHCPAKMNFFPRFSSLCTVTDVGCTLNFVRRMLCLRISVEFYFMRATASNKATDGGNQVKKARQLFLNIRI